MLKNYVRYKAGYSVVLLRMSDISNTEKSARYVGYFSDIWSIPNQYEISCFNNLREKNHKKKKCLFYASN